MTPNNLNLLTLDNTINFQQFLGAVYSNAIC